MGSTSQGTTQRLDREGTTLLMRCVKTSNRKRAKRLIRCSSIDLNEQDVKGNTALMWVLDNQDVHLKYSSAYRTFQDLLIYGADVNIQRKNGDTALMLSVSHDNTCMADLLNHGADLNITNDWGETALIIASKKKCFSCAVMLINAGSFLDVVDMWGNTAFSYALGLDTLDIAASLIHCGARFDQRDSDGNTMLMKILQAKREKDDKARRFKICERMVLSGADVNAQNKYGQTPLMIASKNSTCGVDTLDMLLENGANIDIKDNFGMTAFNFTIAFHLWKICSEKITWFFEKGADPVITGDSMAIQSRLGLRKEIGCEFLNHLIEEDEDQILKILVCNGVFPRDFHKAHSSHKDAYSVSPFLYALLSNRHDVARYLLANCFLLPSDVKDRRTRCIALSPVVDDESSLILEELSSAPFPLVKLAFVAVSTALGSFPARTQRVEGLHLPVRMKKMLLFQEPVSRLCPHQWEEIPVNVRNYDQINHVSRPLLYFWPFGVRKFDRCCEHQVETTQWIDVSPMQDAES